MQMKECDLWAYNIVVNFQCTVFPTNIKLELLPHENYTCYIQSAWFFLHVSCCLSWCRKKVSRQKESVNLDAVTTEQRNSSFQNMPVPQNVRTMSIRINKHTAEGVASTTTRFLCHEKNSGSVQKDHAEPTAPVCSPANSTVVNDNEVKVDTDDLRDVTILFTLSYDWLI